MKKIIFVLSMIALILVALMLAQAARAEAPEYGTCQVFSWQPDRVWFNWLNAPPGAARFDVTLFLINTRTGVEILTGNSYPPYFIGPDAFILFDGVDFLRGEWIIHDLTCIANFASGGTAVVKNGGPWVMFHDYLPVVTR